MAHKTLTSNSNAKTWIYSAISFGLSMGVFYSLLNNKWAIGMGGGLGAGVLFATVICWVNARQTKRLSVERFDLNGEAILFEGTANHFKGVEGVGGYLWLTSEQLFFRSHRFNFQNHECRIPVSQIAKVEATKTLGIIPNGLLVHHVSGSRERFVVHKNRDWAAKILGAKISIEEKQMNQSPTAQQ